MERGVRRAGRRTHRGKATAPNGAVAPNPLAREGAAADAAVAERRRRTTSRRELARNPRFEQVSPEVGELDEAAVDDGLVDDPDETLALLADLAGATDRRAARAGPPARRTVVPRSRPARAGACARRRQDQRAALRPDGGDLDLDASFDAIAEARAGGVAVDAERSARPVVGHARHRAVPAGRSQRIDGWQAAGDRSGGRGGRRLAQRGELQRAGVRQGRRRREEPGRRQGCASVSSTTCWRCAATAPPISPAPCARPATSWAAAERRARSPSCSATAGRRSTATSVAAASSLPRSSWSRPSDGLRRGVRLRAADRRADRHRRRAVVRRRGAGVGARTLISTRPRRRARWPTSGRSIAARCQQWPARVVAPACVLGGTEVIADGTGDFRRRGLGCGRRRAGGCVGSSGLELLIGRLRQAAPALGRCRGSPACSSSPCARSALPRR